MSDELRAKLLKEAGYKERLAGDIDRAGGWQAHLHRDKAAQLRREAA